MILVVLVVFETTKSRNLGLLLIGSSHARRTIPPTSGAMQHTDELKTSPLGINMEMRSALVFRMREGRIAREERTEELLSTSNKGNALDDSFVVFI